jgi:hypothetical protein
MRCSTSAAPTYRLPALLALALFLLAGATFRLWDLWLETRRLLVSLDALPLRRGFEKLQGFSWTPIWRLGAGGMADFRKLAARELEAMAAQFPQVGSMVSSWLEPALRALQK